MLDTMDSIINSDIPKHDNVASLMADYTVNSRGELTKKSTKKREKIKRYDLSICQTLLS